MVDDAMADAASQALLRVEVITLFPRMVESPLSESILGKAQQRGLLQVRARDLRPYGIGKHQVTDDVPYGGGPGMVMKPEPLVAAIEASRTELGPESRVILLDPQGAPFVQATAARLAGRSALIFVCGRYEGVDERVRPHVDETLSLGDFVLTGGEVAAVCMIDAIARLRPGVLGNDTSSTTESWAAGLLEGPQYTRPPDFRGAGVPQILLSGDHAKIARWRLREALQRTRDHRPDALAKAELSPEARKILKDLPRELPFPSGQGIGHAPEAALRGLQDAPRGPPESGQGGKQDERPGGSRSGGDGNALEGD